MNTTTIKRSNIANSPVVREYEIGNTKYIVRATVKPGVSEDAKTKVRRLIRNDMGRRPEQQ